MKNIRTTLNNLTTSANKEQQERIACLLQAITNLENNDTDAAAAFVQLADYHNDYEIISADTLTDIVRGLDDVQSMVHMLSDISGSACAYKLDGYGWAVDINADDLALYIEEMANELAADIN